MVQYEVEDIVRAFEGAMIEMDPESRDRWIAAYDIDKMIAILSNEGDDDGAEEEGTEPQMEEAAVAEKANTSDVV